MQISLRASIYLSRSIFSVSCCLGASKIRKLNGDLVAANSNRVAWNARTVLEPVLPESWFTDSSPRIGSKSFLKDMS